MYNADWSWPDWSRQAEMFARPMVERLIMGEELYNRWQNYRAGRTNAQLATALGRTETEVSELDAAFAALHTLYQCANNVDVSQSDYLYSLRKFA